jgi:hypothetical protein
MEGIWRGYGEDMEGIQEDRAGDREGIESDPITSQSTVNCRKIG